MSIGRRRAPSPTSLRRQQWRRCVSAMILAGALFGANRTAVAQATKTGTITGRVTDGERGSNGRGEHSRLRHADRRRNRRWPLHDSRRTPRRDRDRRYAHRLRAEGSNVTVTANETVHGGRRRSAGGVLALGSRRHGDGRAKKAEIANTVASVDIARQGDRRRRRTRSANCSPDRRRACRSFRPARRAADRRIRIRGQSSLSLGNAPVVYVDGVKVNSEATTGSATRSSRFDDINPDEIENIDILKGPAAATLYGTEAANGVINITTKKGKAGATRWAFFGENSVSKDQDAGHYRDLWISFQKNANGTLTQCQLTQVATGACHID